MTTSETQAPVGAGVPGEGSGRRQDSARDAVHRRVLRRETHRSRSFPAVLAMVLAVLIALAVAVAAAVVLADERIGGLDPRAMLRDAVRPVPQGAAAIVVCAGALSIVIGLVFLVLGVLPSRRARHTVPSERLAVVVDDEVIASAIARASRDVTRLGPDSVVASVGRRRAEVLVRPPSGADIPVLAITEAAREELAAIRPEPSLDVAVRVRPIGQGAS